MRVIVSFIDKHRQSHGVESICRQLPIDPEEYATLEWVGWFNPRRLLGSIGDVPPAEFEQAYYDQLDGSAKAA